MNQYVLNGSKLIDEIMVKTIPEKIDDFIVVFLDCFCAMNFLNLKYKKFYDKKFLGQGNHFAGQCRKSGRVLVGPGRIGPCLSRAWAVF